jgi:hypothetical protein
MDRCLTEEPHLTAVGSAGEHRSACWLPVAAAGTAGDAEEIRKRAVEQGRHDAAAKVAEAIAAAPESEGSVIA